LQGHVVIRHPASSNWEEPLDVEHLHGHGAEAGRVSLCVFFLGCCRPLTSAWRVWPCLA
jgi:hypothetical protein